MESRGSYHKTEGSGSVSCLLAVFLSTRVGPSRSENKVLVQLYFPWVCPTIFITSAHLYVCLLRSASPDGKSNKLTVIIHNHLNHGTLLCVCHSSESTFQSKSSCFGATVYIKHSSVLLDNTKADGAVRIRPHVMLSLTVRAQYFQRWLLVLLLSASHCLPSTLAGTRLSSVAQ